MSEQVLLQLRKRSSHETITEPFQIDNEEPIGALSAYLNALYSTSEEYLFFYNELQLSGNLSEFIKNQNISTENLLTIDYMLPDDQESAFSVSLDDTVTFLIVSRRALMACTHYGKVFDLSGSDQPKEMAIKCRNPHGEYGIWHKSVISLNDGSVVREFEGEIREISSCGENIAVGEFNSPRISIIRAVKDDSNGFNESIPVSDFFRSLLLTNSALYWVESLNLIFKYEKETKKITNFSYEATITKIDEFNDIIYAGTSCGLLLVVENGNVSSFKVSIRLCKDIKVNGDVIALLSDYKLVLLDRTDLKQRNNLFFKEQANTVVFFNNLVYVGHGNKVSAFKYL